MKILLIILGAIMAFCGFSCMCTPLITFLEAGYFIVILLFLYGIGAVIETIREKRIGLPFLFGILSMVLAVVIMVVPGLKLRTDGILVHIMAAWFLIQGVVDIVMAFSQKRQESGKRWIWMLVLGILGALVGIYSLMHPLLMALTFGVLTGVYFVECGVNMIALACAVQAE